MRVTNSKDGTKRVSINVLHRLTGQEVADCLAVHVDLHAQNLAINLRREFERLYGSRFRIMAAVKSTVAAGHDTDDDFEGLDDELRAAALAYVRKYFPEFWVH
jgi:hypothetical protein